MELKQSSVCRVYQAWNTLTGRYQSLWDGYDYDHQFSDDADLICRLKEEHGETCISHGTFEIHKIEITSKRIE